MLALQRNSWGPPSHGARESYQDTMTLTDLAQRDRGIHDLVNDQIRAALVRANLVGITRSGVT